MLLKIHSYSITCFLPLCPTSSRMSSRKDRPDDGGWGARPLHQVPGDLPQPADPPGAGGSAQNLWSVTWFFYTSLIPHLLLFFSQQIISSPSQVTSTDSTQTCWGSSSMAASLRRPTTCSWATTWTEESSLWRPYVCFWRTRSNTPRTSSCSGATTSVPQSTASTASTTSVSSFSLPLSRQLQN